MASANLSITLWKRYRLDEILFTAQLNTDMRTSLDTERSAVIEATRLTKQPKSF